MAGRELARGGPWGVTRSSAVPGVAAGMTWGTGGAQGACVASVGRAAGPPVSVTAPGSRVTGRALLLGHWPRRLLRATAALAGGCVSV